MSDDADPANLVIMVATYGMALISMQKFAAHLIAAGMRGSRLDGDALDAIRQDTILTLKNSEARGFSIEAEAKSMGNAINLLSQVIDMAIANGRKEHEAGLSARHDDQGSIGMIDDDTSFHAVTLSNDVEAAILAFAAAQMPTMARGAVISYLLRDHLIALGYLKPPPDDPEMAN